MSEKRPELSALAPIAPKEPQVDERHGERRVDEYSWLRDREDPRVLPYLRAENDYADELMEARTGDLRARLFREMKQRIPQRDTTVPVPRRGYEYYSRVEPELEYAIHCRRKLSGDGRGREEVILDENALAEGMDYLDVGCVAVSPDHRYVAYTLDVQGDELYELRIHDLEQQTLLAERMQRVGDSVVWANDSRSFFYDVQDASHRPYRAMCHRLGDAVKDDKIVFEEADEAFYLGIYKTRTDAYIVISLGSQVTSEMHLVPADDPEREPRCLVPREQDVEYIFAHGPDGRSFFLTNKGAENFKVLEFDLEGWLQGEPPKAEMTEAIPHRPEVLVEDIDCFQHHLCVWERCGGLSRVRVLDLRGSTEDQHLIDFPDPAYSLWPGANPNYESDELRFGYSSLRIPASVYAYHLDRRERRLLKRDEVVGGHDPEEYVSERVEARAADGTKIPISLVYRRLERSDRRRPSPLVLYGYGAYGASSEASFSDTRLTLLDRGVVWAIAHVRGGDELGRAWYEAGRLEHKRNSFSDFADCARYLIERGYTQAHQLAAVGGSAGGLLMGAVANQNPELFRAIVADVPFVDVLNTMLDPTLPLTVSEREEWGNPEEERDYQWIRVYSPYDNVRAQDYPSMLVLAGLSDPRVGYWEPAKWTARLRDRKTDENDLLLWTNLEAGHAGASGRFAYLKEVALEYAFLLHQLGALPHGGRAN